MGHRSGDTSAPPPGKYNETRTVQLYIDFAGFAGLGEDISVEESYCCKVRGFSYSLYFWRVKQSRDRWRRELAAFVSAVDQVADSESGTA